MENETTNTVRPAQPGLGRKKKRNPEKWKRSIEKKQRYSSKVLPKKPGCVHKGTHQYECKELNMQDVRKFHDNFYNIAKTENAIKEKQDCYILRYITIKSPKRSRARTDHGSRKGLTAKYYVPRYRQQSNTGLVQVCQKTFLSILNISKSRVQRLLKNQITDMGSTPKEKRGGDRKTIVFAAKRQNVKSFIEKLEASESHYTRDKSIRQYLQSDLTIRKLWRMYNNQENLDVALKVKYWYFRDIFVSDYNVSCGTSATDKCSRCIQLKEMLKVSKIQGEKNDLIIALRAKAFFSALKADVSTQVTYSFDCQKNMVLPKIPDQQCYFSRQFYVYNFTMCKGSSMSKQNIENTFTYTWNELQRGKGSNEIVSCVHDHLKNTNFEPGQSGVRLFADGCGGQNKNSILIGMLSKWLLLEAPRQVKTLSVFFPTPGHSYMPPDRVFGRIEKIVKRKETIVKPEEYHEIFSQFATVKNAVGQVLKKPGKWHFKFAPTKRFILSRSKGGNILLRGETSYNSDTGNSKIIALPNKNHGQINPERVALGLPPKPAKATDVKKLLEKHFGPHWNQREDVDFYKSALTIEGDREETDEEQDEPMDDMELFV